MSYGFGDYKVKVDCTRVPANAFPGMPPPPFWTPLHLGLIIGGASLLLFIISTAIKVCVFRHIARRRAASGFPADPEIECCPCCRPAKRRPGNLPVTSHGTVDITTRNPMEGTEWR